MSERWISQRVQNVDSSGIRKVFDLASRMTNPVNLSIGQPHYDTPEPVRDALCRAVQGGKNGYSQSQGIPALRRRLQADLDEKYGHADRQVFLSAGTTGALMLSLLTLTNPGDEVILFDPWFVMYKHLTALAGATVVEIDTYPDFRIDPARVEAAITDRTRVILCNSPANPTGRVASAEELRALADIAAERDIALVSDEIYSAFVYDETFHSPAEWNEKTIVIDGFSKSYSMTGLRLGFVHGPSHLQMIKLHQFTFICAPHPVQWAGLSALDCDISHHVADYRNKRDYMLEELGDLYDIRGADGAFYLFSRTPWGTGTEFVEQAIASGLLIIPGGVFSPQDTHFRLSYAATDRTLQRGVEILKQLAHRHG